MAEREMTGLDNILFRRTDNNRAAQKSISSDSCCARMNLDRGPPIHGPGPPPRANTISLAAGASLGSPSEDLALVSL